ncbi:MAG: ATP-binding protein [Candidatus Caenarcaniphilales bacterium]|nr:ATP-binding protein [Candidatus Caenarcaniphilales bacterium]
MHQTAFHALPEKNLGEIVKLIGRVLWFNFLFPKVTRIQNKTKSISPEVQKLHLEAHRIQGELTLLEANLNSLPYIKGSISDRCVKDQVNPNKVHVYPLLRWYENGVRRHKHIVKVKKKDGDLTLEEAKVLVANADKAEVLKKEIKERKNRLSTLEAKLTIFTGKPIQIENISIKEITSNPLIGRDKEFSQLQSNLLHNISTLVIGEPGIGKSFLVESLIDSQERPYIWIENLKAARNVLIDQVIEKLHRDGNLRLDEDNYSGALSLEDLKSKCLKNKSIAQLAEIISDSIIISSSKANPYVVVIESMAGLTQANQIIIEKLIDTGAPIIACANKIKGSIELESLYRRFTRLELEPLPNQAMKDFLETRIQNIYASEDNRLMLKTKILNAACGNIGIASKMLKDAQALSLSGGLKEDQIRALQEPELPRKYFDLTPVVILGVASFAVLRFIGLGTNDTLLYIMGGIAFVIFMAFSRIMMKAWSK